MKKINLCFFFFFQAEDGIRATSVTGVQTCALPIGALERLGPAVIVGDPEGLHQGPIDCLLSRRASMARCTTTWPRASLQAYDEVDRAAQDLGVGFLRTRGFACYQRQCPAVIGRVIAWSDNNHLSAVYSAELADAFRAGFVR